MMPVNPLMHLIIMNLANNTFNNCTTCYELDTSNSTTVIEDHHPEKVDLTEKIVTAVGKTLALLYCIGLVLIVLYYCYAAPRDSEITVSIRCRSNHTAGGGSAPEGAERRRMFRYKDLPPSYESIHLSDLPPHYEDVALGKNLSSNSFQMHPNFVAII